MKKIVLILFFIIALPSGIFASDYKDFTQDLIKPYGFYRKSLALTHAKGKEAEARVMITKLISAWQVFAKTYANDKPDAFASIDDFANKISKPVEISSKALVLLEAGKAYLAHIELEEIRYILWDMRVKSQIVCIEDKLNDFHEAMEVVLDDIEEAQRKGKLKQGCSRRDLWLAIKWEEVAQSKGSGCDKQSFEKAIKEGRNAIKGIIKARENGDIEGASEFCKAIKKSFKNIFFVPR
jgi:hypothetical protein